MLRNDEDVIPIDRPVTIVPWQDTEDSSFLNDDDAVETSEEDDESVQEHTDEETDFENDIDSEEDDEDDSYHASNSN